EDRYQPRQRIRSQHLPVAAVTVLEDVVEITARHQLHAEIVSVVCSLAEVVDRRDAGMLEPASDPRFLDEATPVALIVAHRQQHLDCDAPAEGLTHRFEHPPHATAAQLAHDSIMSQLALRGRGDPRRRAGMERMTDVTARHRDRLGFGDVATMRAGAVAGRNGLAAGRAWARLHEGLLRYPLKQTQLCGLLAHS